MQKIYINKQYINSSFSPSFFPYPSHYLLSVYFFNLPTYLVSSIYLPSIYHLFIFLSIQLSEEEHRLNGFCLSNCVKVKQIVLYMDAERKILKFTKGERLKVERMENRHKGNRKKEACEQIQIIFYKKLSMYMYT